jgi:hypothetical protein
MSRKGGVNLPPGFNAKDRKYSKFSNKLPTRETCDLTEPSEMFLWMLVALPGVNGGHQVMPSSYNMLVSEHLHQCGAMLTCEQCGYTRTPEKQYVPPATKDPHWLTSPGTWKNPKDVLPEEDPMDVALDQMTPQLQAALHKRLEKRLKGER